MMSVTMMGTIGSYTQTLKLQTQWNLKKQSGDLTSHKKSLDEWLQTSTASTSSANNTSSTDKIGNGDSKLRSIQAKVDAGKKLTEQERAYLKEKDPETYAELEADEQQQRAYEQKLKRCRTKEEVQRLKMAHVGTSLAKVNAVKNDPNISLEKKLRIAKQELRRCNDVEESTQGFVRRGDYEKLPTDQELAKAEREEASRDTQDAQDTQDAENTESAAQDTKTSDAADAEPEAPAKPQAQKPEKAAPQTESPELSKTRRAKARAAYAYIQTPKHIQDAAAPSVDWKA